MVNCTASGGLPLSPGEYVLGQSVVTFEQQCSDVVLSNLVVINGVGTTLNICGADGIPCFPEVSFFFHRLNWCLGPCNQRVLKAKHVHWLCLS